MLGGLLDSGNPHSWLTIADGSVVVCVGRVSHPNLYPLRRGRAYVVTRFGVSLPIAPEDGFQEPTWGWGVYLEGCRAGGGLAWRAGLFSPLDLGDVDAASLVRRAAQ